MSPRVVKRAISPYVASTAKGRLHGHSYKATLSIETLTGDHLTVGRRRITERPWP